MGRRWLLGFQSLRQSLRHGNEVPTRSITTLAYEEVTAPEGNRDADDESWWKTAIVMHGLMGSGKNWRSFSRNLANSLLSQSPPGSSGWRMILVDLRNHGQSAALEGFTPPHDMSSAAMDVASLIKAKNWHSPDVVIGHSMGGKVALAYAESCARGNYGNDINLPKQLWVLDSVPGEVPMNDDEGEVERVLSTLKSLPHPIPSRRWFVEHMTKLGFSKSLSDWLASNLKRVNVSSEEVTWTFHIDGILEMFNSYRSTSYWRFLQNVPQGLEVSIVQAEKSDRWQPAMLDQLTAVVNSEQRPNTGKVFHHLLANAGHWLHVDNPKGLTDIMVPSLKRL